MTQYHGGKQRIGEQNAAVIASVCKDYNARGYVEPFCGMLGVYQHIPGLLKVKNYRAGDVNKSVILMWKAAQRGWVPPEYFSKQQFNALKGDGESSALKGFVGHACAARGIYFAPFTEKTSLPYSSRRIIHISNVLREVQFRHTSYNGFSNLQGYIIYCDPPYFKSSRYSYEDGVAIKFDYDKFYRWAKKMAENNIVLISEIGPLPYRLVASFGDEKLYLV